MFTLALPLEKGILPFGASLPRDPSNQLKAILIYIFLFKNVKFFGKWG